MNKALRDRFGFSYDQAAFLSYHYPELAAQLLDKADPKEILAAHVMLRKVMAGK